MRSQFEYELINGNKIPAVGLGTWGLSGEKCTSIVKKALELGYQHIDTAEMYRNQSDIGKALQAFDRSKIFITSKVWWTNLHYDDVIEACDRTLREIGIEYLDLYLIHWPNEEISLEETFKAFKELASNGRVINVGVSNFTIDNLKNALGIAEIPITINQVKFHPKLYKRELLEFCKKKRIILTAYSPLGRGALTLDGTLREIAKQYNRTPAQICLRWGLQKGVVVIPKSGSEVHLKQNLDIFDWEISEEEAYKIDSLT